MKVRDTVFKELENLFFFNVDIFIIHENAFEEELVKNIKTLFFFRNKLSKLPDNVFKPFRALLELDLEIQDFVTLNNNLFGQESTLSTIFMTRNTKLTSFPEFMRETPNLEVLIMRDADSLVTANSAAFENLNNLQRLAISDDMPILVELGREELLRQLGIDDNLDVDINLPEPEEDFCAEFSLTDSAMRETLAKNFDIALDLGVDAPSVIYNDVELGCLPENAFSQLNISQRTSFQVADTLGFVFNVLILKIHPNAFEEALVKDIKILGFCTSELSELLDNVFKPFKALKELVLANQNFINLENNLVGEESALTTLRLLGNDQLTSFPEFMRETPNLENLIVRVADSLVNLNSAAFENLNKLQTLTLSGDIPLVVQSDVEQIRIELGLGENVNVELE